jgi:hypothetical protein
VRVDGVECANNHARPESVLALEEQAFRNYSERACQAEKMGEIGLKLQPRKDDR